MPRQEVTQQTQPTAVKPGARTFTVLDVQALDRAKPEAAVKTFVLSGKPRIVRCAVFIAGGGMGGVAAAIRAAKGGVPVCVTEETDWLGGQSTQQGVSALDENYLVETSGATRLYQKWRHKIRSYYRQQPTAIAEAAADEFLNPGNCWVTRLSFEPQVALSKLDELISEETPADSIRTFMRFKVVKLKVVRGRVRSALAVDLDSGKFTEFRAKLYLDATELGDLLPLAAVPYRSGAESQTETGEPHAPQAPDAQNVQDFTYPFVVELKPGTNNTIEKPANFDRFNGTGKFTFAGYKMFSNNPAPGGSYEFLPFWTYRRLISSELFKGNDLAMINWESNDLRGENIIDQDATVAAQRLALGKDLSLGFLYWLQTEAPRDDGGKGYPELLLRTDLLGTADGASKYPYIRESRRIIAKTTVVEQDIAAATNSGARARLFRDSVGIGLYPIDIHGHQDVPGAGQAARPFQIPLGALVQTSVRNLIPAAKNIGTTHVTNGAYRLHPVEWAIGEAAGTLAADCYRHHTTPDRILRNRRRLRSLQLQLIEGGAPLFWFDDIATDHQNFAAIQFLCATGIMPQGNDDLSFNPDVPITASDAAAVLRKFHLDAQKVPSLSRADFAQLIFDREGKSRRWLGRL